MRITGIIFVEANEKIDLGFFMGVGLRIRRVIMGSTLPRHFCFLVEHPDRHLKKWYDRDRSRTKKLVRRLMAVTPRYATYRGSYQVGFLPMINSRSLWRR